MIIDSPEENNTSKEASHLYLARKLATEVIDRPELYTAEDLVNIFKIISSRKMKMHILQQSHYQQIETIFGSLLNELSFESV